MDTTGMMKVAIKLCVLLVVPSLLASSRASDEVMTEDIAGLCSAEDNQEINKLVRETKCSPRPAHVAIRSNDVNLQMSPQFVIVNRCAGFCSHQKSCLPVKETEIEVPRKVQWRNYFMRMAPAMCGTITVKEHTECRCQCTIKNSDCSEVQDYDAKNCMCKCKNMDMMEECNNREGWRWNQEKCRCECAMEKECSSGLEWIQGRCACGRVEMVPEENENELDTSDEAAEE